MRSPLQRQFRLALWLAPSVVLSVVLFWPVPGQSQPRGDDFCAVTLHVLSTEAMPVTSTWLELIDQSGKIEMRTQTEGATIKICDFDFGPHILRVGTNECLPVSISNIRLVVGSPLHLEVILNGCGYREVMRNACLLYLRTVDDDGKPVPEAEISLRPIPAAPPKSDSYGRYQTLFQGSRSLILTKAGFEPAEVEANCQENEELDLKVVMHRSKNK